MNMPTFQSQGITPTATGELAVYPEPSTIDLVDTSSEQAPRRTRRSASSRVYKPFYYLLLVYLFIYCSRITELIPNAHIGMVLQPVLLIGVFMTGRMKAILRMPLGKIMIAFTAWITICVPFSIWRGGSFSTFLIVLQALALIIFMAAFIQTIPDCFRVMYTIALAAASIGFLSLVVHSDKINNPRLVLGAKGNTLADSNTLCLYILIGLPFLWLTASVKTGFKKVMMLALMVPMLAGAARTGSRMGLLILVAGLFFYFIFASAKQRMIIVAGGVVFLVLALSLLPQRIRERITTYFEAHSAQAEEAAESAEIRKRLLIRGIQLTAEHPFFGVGPGQFIEAEAQEAQAEGSRPMWHYTHNSYAELSSETGIPGVVLFIMALFGAYRGLSPIRKRYPDSRVRQAALFTQVAVVMTSVGAFFLSVSYGGIIVVIIATSATLQAAVANKTKLARRQALQGHPMTEASSPVA